MESRSGVRMICLISSVPMSDGSVPLTRASSAVSIVSPPVLAANCAAEIPPTPSWRLALPAAAPNMAALSWKDMVRMPADGLRCVPLPSVSAPSAVCGSVRAAALNRSAPFAL